MNQLLGCHPARVRPRSLEAEETLGDTNQRFEADIVSPTSQLDQVIEDFTLILDVFASQSGREKNRCLQPVAIGRRFILVNLVNPSDRTVKILLLHRQLRREQSV